MGGIQCVTPFYAIEPDTVMNRDSERNSAAAVAQMGHVEIFYYGKEKSAGLRKVKVSDIAKYFGKMFANHWRFHVAVREVGLHTWYTGVE